MSGGTFPTGQHRNLALREERYVVHLSDAERAALVALAEGEPAMVAGSPR